MSIIKILKIIYKYKFNKNLSTIPISFQIKEKINVQKIFLYYRKINIGHILVNEIFMIDENDLLYLYGINDKNKFFHPGFVYQKSLGKYAVGGKPIINRNNFKFFEKKYDLKKSFSLFFKNFNMKDPIAFQTRNPPHKGHEFQLKKSLSFSNNLVINPIFGWKKKGDFKESAIEGSYKIFIRKNKKKIYFKPIQTNMRYLGPREAIHHAIIRENLGFSYFIVGRDHAGVGNFYKKYEAFELIKKLNCEKKLKIKFLKFKEPKICLICNKIFSKKL